MPSNNTPFLANPKPLLAAPLAIKSPPIIIEGLGNQISARKDPSSVINPPTLSANPGNPSLASLTKMHHIAMRGGPLTKGIHMPSKQPVTNIQKQSNDGSLTSDHI